jgi:Cys-tRNA(Pro) deacylase
MELAQELSDRDIKHELTEFPAEVFTSEDVAQALNIKLSQVAKAMLVKVSNHSYAIALLPGDKRLSLKSLSSALNNAKVTLARRSDVKEATGLSVGAVSPLIALRVPKIKVFVDTALAEEDEINISSGDLRIGITLKTRDLIDVIQGKICPISE